MYYARRRKSQMVEMNPKYENNDINSGLAGGRSSPVPRLKHSSLHARISMFNARRRKSEMVEINANYENNVSDAGLEGGPSSSMSYAKHPPHLRGKAIGMFYARRNKGRRAETNVKSKTKEIDTKKLPTMVLKKSLVNKFLEFLDYLKGAHDYVTPLCFEESSQNEVPTDFISAQIKNCPRRITCLLSQIKALDRKLYQDFNLRDHNSTLQEFRKKLPAFEKQHDILNAINDNQVVLIMGETGCGKTTQVPQFILDNFIKSEKGSMCKVICTQPRRISAITVAERVAEERGISCGSSEVGFQIRLQSMLPAERGSILFCTTGILLQWLQNDPYLVNASHVIVDEVHERDLLSDFSLVILRDLLNIRRDLKLILMSATLNYQCISEYFGGCPTIAIHGVAFPVEVIMLEDIIEETKYVPIRGPPQKPIWARIKDKKAAAGRLTQDDVDEKMKYLQHLRNDYSQRTVDILSKWNDEEIDLDLIVCIIRDIMSRGKEGAILVFLPGWEQIKKLKNILASDRYIYFRCIIVPLHSLMPTINQREAFQRPPCGKQKIIIATNIAETSITIEDVVFVIDSGKIKLKNFDPEQNLATIKAEWVAKANAKQRKGRAGRTRNGICFRLFTRYQEQKLEEYQLPEMLRTRLEEIILKIKLLKLGYAEEFLQKAMDPPSSDTVKVSLNLLKKLKALDHQENLTSLGYHLAKLPMDPQTGKMCIFGAIFSCLDPILSIAASLSFREAFVIPLGEESKVDQIKKHLSKGTESDHMMMHFALQGWEDARNKGNEMHYCHSNYLSVSTLRMLGDLKQQIAEYLHELKFLNTVDSKHPDYNKNSHNIFLLKAVISSGLYPNVAKLCRPSGGRKHGKFIPLVKAFDSDGTRVTLHPRSTNSKETVFQNDLLVYYLKVKSTQTFLHDTTFVNYIPLILFGETFDVENINGIEILCIDHWLRVKCSSSTISLMKELREVLDVLLCRIFKTPQFSNSNDWKRFSELIIELLSSDINLGA